MDEDLKRRLIGAAIVSVLLIVIVPYFFEDKDGKKKEDLPEAMVAQSLALPGAIEPSGEAVSEPEEDESQPIQAPPTPKKRKYEMVPLTDETPAKATKAESGVQKVMPAEADDDAEIPMKPMPREMPASASTPPESAKKSRPVAASSPAVSSDHAATVSKPKPSTPKDREKPAAKKPEPSEGMKTGTHSPEAAPKSQKKTAPATQDPVKKPGVASAPSAPASHPSAYLVQAGTFSDENNARTLAEKIKKRNLPVRVQTIETSNGKIYRVTVGPGFDHQKAEQVQKQLSEQDGVKGMILQTH